jgi:hypothetical protein
MESLNKVLLRAVLEQVKNSAVLFVQGIVEQVQSKGK